MSKFGDIIMSITVISLIGVCLWLYVKISAFCERLFLKWTSSEDTSSSGNYRAAAPREDNTLTLQWRERGGIWQTGYRTKSTGYTLQSNMSSLRDSMEINNRTTGINVRAIDSNGRVVDFM